MNLLKSLVLCLILSSFGPTVLAQSIDLPGLRHLRPFLEYKVADDILPVDFSYAMQADEIYQVLLIEVAIQDGNYELAARESLNFLKDIKNSSAIAERATKLHLALDKPAQALEAVRYWVQLDKGKEAKTLFYLLLGDNQKTRELADHLRADLLRAQEGHDQELVLYEMATLLEELNDRQAAKDVFDYASHGILQDSADLHMIKSNFAVRVNYMEEAWDEAFKALDIDPSMAPAAGRILFLAQGPRRAQALNFVQSFLHKYPASRELYLAYIQELARDRDYKEATAELKRMRQANPEDFELLYFEALLHKDAQQYESARKLLIQFIEIQKQRQQTTENESTNSKEMEVLARMALASVYAEEKKYSLALAQLDKLKPEDTTLEVDLEKARLYARLGQITKALDKLSSIKSESDEEKSMVYLVGGDILQTSGRTDQAIAYLDRALKDLPDDNSIKYSLAMLYEMRGQLDLTERYLRQVIDAQPSDAHAYNALGYVFADNNYNLTEAQSLLERALVFDPHSPYILDSMGWLQFRLGNYMLALEYLELAYEIDEQVEIAAHLADVYVVLGNPERAKAILLKAQEQDKDNEVLRQTIRRLDLGIKP
ncbi:MAG: tetratricopeptide repeat protein [Pelistega sp.]|nr:tetratricopeptide repeat protein [Pelistega sp.]